jgi:sugar-specific transcriptional regulator TrmB
MDKVEPLLKDIGMKEYEAKAFTAVLKCGICSADQISHAAQIPLTRVYETMASLQKLGLITVMNTRPKKYRLISVDGLSNLIEEKKRELQQEINRVSDIVKQIKDNIPKTTPHNAAEVKEDFWIFKGRETALRKISEEKKKAEKEITFFSDDFSWFPRLRKVVQSAIKEGVVVKVLINLNEKTIQIVNELLKIGADVRGWDVRGLLGVIVDGKTVQLVSKIPRTGVKMEEHYGEQGSDELFMYDLLYTENPLIVNMVKTYFDVFWWRGERPQGLIMARQGKRFK